MKRILYAFLLLSITHTGSKLSAQPDTILLFHPTAGNIETFSLIFNEVVEDVSDSEFHFLGVYHEHENYDYNKSLMLIDSMNAGKFNFSLYCVKGLPESEQIYTENVFYEQFEKLFRISIGSIFTGGPDLPPGLYDEEMHLLTDVTDPWRHYMEISALSCFLGSSLNPHSEALMEQDPDYLILGICLGMQSMNVATGGSMVQDIPTELYHLYTREDILRSKIVKHRNYTFDDPSDGLNLTSYHFHPIDIDPESRFSELFQPGAVPYPYVLSSHHQALESLGKDLKVAARSPDQRIIEAVEHEKYPAVFGVQFHPEKTGLFNSQEIYYVSPENPVQFQSYAQSKQSDSFHYHFWNVIHKLLQENHREMTME